MSEPKFEDALKKLEKIVQEMEGAELSLDDSLKKYEEGIKLSRLCLNKLEETQKKIEILQKGADGKSAKKKFRPQAGENAQPAEDRPVPTQGSGGELPF
jgi:exodeoxyribonuclease VII small subunit